MNVQHLTIAIIELILFLSHNMCCSLNGTYAIILARGGSKGIRNKNLIWFNGNTLLGATIQTIRKSGLFVNIWVSTDSELIEKEALKHDALVYRRLDSFAQDHSSSLVAVREFLYKHSFVQRFGLFQCTSVFLKEKYLVEAFHKFQYHPCVFAAARSYKLRWKRLKSNLILPLNFSPTKRPRRQDWEGEFYETGMFYFTNRELISKNAFQNHKCAIVEVATQHALEIDNLNDLKMAQCILETDQQINFKS